MGGNLFKLGRLPRAQYLEIETTLRAYLDDAFGAAYRIPRYYGSKADFGDVDILLSSDVAQDRAALHARIIGDLGVERHKYTGSVLSTVYRNFQVDFFVLPAHTLEAGYNFMSFNDLGNLLGRIFRGFNLKYGMRGLSYVFRRDDSNYKRDLEVSTDWRKILAFLELDFGPWEQGFGPLEDMFAWVLTCPYVRTKPYLDPEAPLRKRASVRSTIRRFIDYLEHHGIERHYAHPAEREAYVDRIDAHFGCELASAIAHEREEEAITERIAAKFNGRIVMEATGLEGKALGELMRKLRAEIPRDTLHAMTPEAIREAIRRTASST